MKTIRKLAPLFLILFAFSCNNPQSKTAVNSTIDDKAQPEKAAMIEKGENTHKIDKTVKNESITRESIVKEILTTSPRYKQITNGLMAAVKKNKGQYFGIRLEGSPNPTQDKALSYSKTYDFTLYEMYVDREVNTAHFLFNPQNKLLYEYDEVSGKLMQIEYDKNLLIEFESLSK